MRYYVGRMHSHTVKPHYGWPEEGRWDYLNAIVLHLEYSREFNQILKQSMHQLWRTLSLPLEPKECSETIPLAKRVTSDASSWRMRLTSHPLPTGISNVAQLIFQAFNQPPGTESINTLQSFVSLFSLHKTCLHTLTRKLFILSRSLFHPQKRRR